MCHGYVRHQIAGEVVVQHVVQVRNVQSAPRHVRRQQKLRLARLEVVQDLVAYRSVKETDERGSTDMADSACCGESRCGGSSPPPNPCARCGPVSADPRVRATSSALRNARHLNLPHEVQHEFARLRLVHENERDRPLTHSLLRVLFLHELRVKRLLFSHADEIK